MMDFNSEYVTAAIQVAIGAATALFAWFINRAVGRVDNNEKSNNSLREEVGLLKAINENQWEDLEELEEKVETMGRENILLNNRLIAVEIQVRRKK
jgi:hypothetical protein